jgi:hypothetical protein
LQQDYDHDKQQFTRHPSWKNLVWAVAHVVGGNNPATARDIAKNHRVSHEASSEPKSKFPRSSEASFRKLTHLIQDDYVYLHTFKSS